MRIHRCFIGLRARFGAEGTRYNFLAIDPYAFPRTQTRSHNDQFRLVPGRKCHFCSWILSSPVFFYELSGTPHFDSSILVRSKPLSEWKLVKGSDFFENYFPSNFHSFALKSSLKTWFSFFRSISFQTQPLIFLSFHWKW